MSLEAADLEGQPALQRSEAGEAGAPSCGVFGIEARVLSDLNEVGVACPGNRWHLWWTGPQLTFFPSP